MCISNRVFALCRPSCDTLLGIIRLHWPGFSSNKVFPVTLKRPPRVFPSTSVLPGLCDVHTKNPTQIFHSKSKPSFECVIHGFLLLRGGSLQSPPAVPVISLMPLRMSNLVAHVSGGDQWRNVYILKRSSSLSVSLSRCLPLQSDPLQCSGWTAPR